MDTPDETLAEAAAGGDRVAFATLIARHHGRIFRLAFRLSGQRADAEDLAQEICASLPKRLRSWRGEARFTTWLYRVVVNAAHDLRRRQGVQARAALGWGERELGLRAEMDEARAAADWLASAMAVLTPELRDTVALVLGEEMTQAEAGRVLGVSEGTIAWRMSEVKRRLRARAVEDGR